MFSESMNIDEWIESLKAYLAGTNPNAATDQVLISQVKSFLSATALKRVKHIFRREACDWVQLKKWMELAFNRHGLKHETIHAKFLLREQRADESFASFHEELWALCDEMTALKAADEADSVVSEIRVINQFAQGIHDRLVRSDVKRFVAQNRLSGEMCSMDVLEAASDSARDHVAEENYTLTYRESVDFLSKRVEEKNTKVKVSNLNPRRTERNVADNSSHNRTGIMNTEPRFTEASVGKPTEFKKRYSGPIVCYKYQQPGHISQGCRNPRVSSDSRRTDATGPSSTRNDAGPDNGNQSKPIRNTRFQEELEQVVDSSSDSSDDVETETRVNLTSVEVNAVGTRRLSVRDASDCC